MTTFDGINIDKIYVGFTRIWLTDTKKDIEVSLDLEHDLGIDWTKGRTERDIYVKILIEEVLKWKEWKFDGNDHFAAAAIYHKIK